MPRRRAGGRAAGPRVDAYRVATERILAALARGTVPWRRPWRARGHRNAVSGHPYRGVNRLLLGLTAAERGYPDPRWLTYRQALAAGGHVRRGEAGTPVVFWRWLPPRGRPGVGADEAAPAAVEDPTGERAPDRVPFLRVYTVFNAGQCAGLALPPVTAVPAGPLARAEAIAAGYRDGPTVAEDADAAYYEPARDAVHLPPRAAFTSADAFYATLFHELAHSTGHPRRLARPDAGAHAPYGTPPYSREELVAEFAAAFLCQEAGVDPSRLEQSAAYVASWLQALEADHRLAVVAAAQAQHAADWILGVRPGNGAWP